MRWTDSFWALTRKLEAARIDDPAQWPRPARYDAHELQGLSSPVQRDFRAVLKQGQHLIATATIEFVGTFNISASGEQWKPFTS